MPLAILGRLAQSGVHLHFALGELLGNPPLTGLSGAAPLLLKRQSLARPQAFPSRLDSVDIDLPQRLQHMAAFGGEYAGHLSSAKQNPSLRGLRHQPIFLVLAAQRRRRHSTVADTQLVPVVARGVSLTTQLEAHAEFPAGSSSCEACSGEYQEWPPRRWVR